MSRTSYRLTRGVVDYLARDASKVVFVGRGGVPPLPLEELVSAFVAFLGAVEQHGFATHACQADLRRYKRFRRSEARGYVTERVLSDQPVFITFTPPGTSIGSGIGGGVTQWEWAPPATVNTYPRRTSAELTFSVGSDAPPWLLDLFVDAAVRFANASGLPQAILSPHNPPALFPVYSAFDRALDARREVFTPELAQTRLREVGWATWLGSSLLRRLSSEVDLNTWPFLPPQVTDSGAWFQISTAPFDLTDAELSRARTFFAPLGALSEVADDR